MDIQIIINLKDRPDVWRPWWYKALSFVKRQIDRAFYYGFDIPSAMGFDKDGRAYWFEICGSRLDEEVARLHCKTKGATWRFRAIPVNGDLPDDTCGYIPEEIPASSANTLSLNHKTPLVAQRQDQLEEGERKIRAMLAQTSKIIIKNRAEIVKTSSA